MQKLRGPIFLFLFVATCLVAYYFGKDLLFDKNQIDTSDATTSAQPINVAGDGYLGYWFINSPKMKAMAPRKGFHINFSDDGGAYAERLEKFADGTYDCIVLPVNSYLQHGLDHKYPGVIVAAISESKGADAIVGFGDVLPTGKINELNNSDLKIVYTGESPSAFLLDLTIFDFDFDRLQRDRSWRKEVGSSEEAYEQARKALKDRSVGDAFVLWEPEVSKAINKLGMKELWSSNKFGGYIIDVFVFNRKFVSSKPEVISDFLTTYFRVLGHYSSNKEEMIKEMSRSTKLDQDVVKTMVSKIDWFDLFENGNEQFGVQRSPDTKVSDKIVNTIIACANVMENTGNYDGSDLDPYRIINSSFLEASMQSGIRGLGQKGNGARSFDALDDSDWGALAEVGTMRVEPINFQSGTNTLDYDGEEVVDRAAKMLVNNYPHYRVIVRGHTGNGDAQANAALSSARAEEVMKRLVNQHQIAPERIRAEGAGATKPPARKAGEPERAYRLRMPRVEFILVESNPL